MRLYSENYCKGQYSIQHEINNLARSSREDWSKRITSQKWRQSVRLKLQTQTNEWCDYKANTCYCEPDYIANKSPYDRAGILPA